MTTTAPPLRLLLLLFLLLLRLRLPLPLLLLLRLLLLRLCLRLLLVRCYCVKRKGHLSITNYSNYGVELCHGISNLSFVGSRGWVSSAETHKE